MPNMQAVYYRMSDGREPVDDFIGDLPLEHQVTIFGQIEQLNALSSDAPPLAFPHSSQVRGQLRELRCHHGRILYRIFHRRSGNLIVLLHTIRKNRGDLPEQDIIIAEQRFEDFQRRMDADPRVPPRAAGHDVP